MGAWPFPEWIENVRAAARLASALPGFLRHRLTVEASAAGQRQRRETREAAWLALVRAAVYGNPRSPYLRLLRRAGCEPGDLEGLVRREGLEEALQHLYRAGVYLTIEEFKGRRPVVRGSDSFSVYPGQLRNPRAAVHAFVRSGGSRGSGMPVPIDLAFLREQSTNTCLVVHARGGAAWHKGHWTVPGGGALNMVLTYAGFGRLPSAWFSQLDPDTPSIPARYRWSARLVCWVSRAARRPLPRPRHVPLDDPSPILRWMRAILQKGEVPLLQTFTSSAVRVCQSAREAGIDLRGVQFTLGGEPVTAARLAVIREVGAEGFTHYGAAETGSALSLGCLAPVQADDSHLTDDLHAFIQPGDAPTSPDLSPHALLITSLRMRAPLVFLNVSLGDEAIFDRRACGCRLEGYGWRTHVHTIRSFEKLTAGGMTFLDVDAIRVLEEVLPARFGGSPADYQLVEEEREDGRSRLLLLVHPAIGPADDGAIADVFLEALGRGEEAKHVMALSWRQAGLLKVERRPPVVTSAGKILHLHRVAGPRRAPASLGAARRE
jgi:hypothetical protein